MEEIVSKQTKVGDKEDERIKTAAAK